jgi:hypothetical protein
VVYAAIDVEKSLQVAYFACFVMTWSTSAPSVLLDVFRNKDAPEYIPALASKAAFGGMGAVLTLGLGASMIFDNRRRDRK